MNTEKVAEKTETSKHGPHPSEYVLLERHSAGPESQALVMGEIDNLVSRVSYGELWPTKLVGRVIDPKSDSVEFTLWLSGVVECEDDDVFAVSADELARVQHVYGWRGAEVRS